MIYIIAGIGVIVLSAAIGYFWVDIKIFLQKRKGKKGGKDNGK